jgi:hypothetical protein
MEREICGYCDAGLPMACTCPPVEELLICPVCPHQVEVSPEDADASLSDMYGHLRSKHYDQSADVLLRDVKLVKAEDA